MKKESQNMTNHLCLHQVTMQRLSKTQSIRETMFLVPKIQPKKKMKNGEWQAMIYTARTTDNRTIAVVLQYVH